MSLTFQEARDLLKLSRSGTNAALSGFVRKDKAGLGRAGARWNEQDVLDLLKITRLERETAEIRGRLRRQKLEV